jgi:uroporphyrinogen decarboxylase
VAAGVDAVQIFDSLGGLLAQEAYEEASARWIKSIVAGLDGSVPVIVFAKGTHGSWDELVKTGARALSVDWTLRLAELAALLPDNIALQGNLDPSVLTTKPAIVEAETRKILEAMRKRPGHIFNLGHGVPPNAKLECVESLVATVRSFK